MSAALTHKLLSYWHAQIPRTRDMVIFVPTTTMTTTITDRQTDCFTPCACVLGNEATCSIVLYVALCMLHAMP